MKVSLFFSALNLIVEKGNKITLKWFFIFCCYFCLFNTYSQSQFFRDYDVTGTNPNCFICHAFQEFTEDAIGSVCVINSTALVTMEVGEYTEVEVRANGIKLTDGTKASAGCWSLFRCEPNTTSPHAPLYEEEIIQIDKYEDVTISPGELDGFEIYQWYDQEGNLIYEGKDLHIADAVAEKYTLRVLDTDGFIGYKDVEIELKPNRIEKLFPNPTTTNNVNITYKINKAESAYIMINSYYMTGGISHNYIVNKEETEININLSNYPLGLYKIALVADGVISDMKILSKQ